MKIDIDDLTEAELVDLNNRIVQRLRFLQQARSHKRMLDFKIGDRVSFQPEGRGVLVGILTRYNRKTVTVITEAGEHWNVAPHFLHRVVEGSSAQEPEHNVIPLRGNRRLTPPNNAAQSDAFRSALDAPARSAPGRGR